MIGSLLCSGSSGCSEKLPDGGAEIDMTASISAPTVVWVDLPTELDVAEAEVLPGLAESPVIPPPQWGYES